ncbi:antitoxin [Actinomycetospora termitidis]|uniref:Antitoxin n=1 Tax=Actinomycetospora termitidis TaxID=3053470 RepID=A0ABT7M288_9PSEU|nr:antitoxin [Actinomycetospora sp. Odt1-22]MDL5154775.1 antitoxin [Actinomycetospora sp. Odt1-22]
MDRDELARQGKQVASDLRDTVSQKVSENQDTIKSTLDKAARWVDEKTGGKYSEQIGKAQGKVDDGLGWVASQGSPASGEPHAPGAAAGDPAPGPTAPADAPTAPGTTPPGPITPEQGGASAAPHAAASPDAPTTAPGPQTPTTPDPDAPRPPQV